MKTKNILLGGILCILSMGLGAQEVALKGKELFGDINARQIGPALMSGRIIDMELHPTNAQVIYTGTAGGGVWKSNDGGASYAPIFDDHIQSIGQVAVDPNDPDQTIWVGTGEIWTRNSVSIGDGLYRTKDGGNNWEKIGFESDNDERGIYKTTDGGKTWKNILSVNSGTGAADFLMDPNNPDVLYAAMWEHYLEYNTQRIS